MAQVIFLPLSASNKPENLFVRSLITEKGLSAFLNA
jgi:hypothetical protein